MDKINGDNSKLITFLTGLFCSTSCLSNILPDTRPWWFSPLVTVSGGIEAARPGSSQTLNMSSDFITYQYNSSDASSNRLLLGIFAGTEIPLQQQRTLQLGLGFYSPGSFSSGRGILTQGVDPGSSDQYTYNYKVKNNLLLAEGKLSCTMQQILHPYALAGLGVSFNNAYSYTTTVPPFLTFTPEFTNNTNTSWAYSLGVGIDVDIQKNWRLGVGYRFANLGQANLGPGLIDTTLFTSTLFQSNLYAQACLMQLTYLFSQESNNEK
jgi:opacity protein-like surface antigen